MQLLLLALVMLIFVHDGMVLPAEEPAALTPGSLLAVVILPKLALAGMYWWMCARVKRRLGRRGGERALRRLDRVTGLYRVLVLGLYAADLWLGALVWVREALGDVILLDELLMMALPVAMLIWQWWAYYPIERRLREAALIGRIDQGLPVYPVWSRGQYIVAQVRHQLALVLGPVLLVLAWAEVVATVVPRRWPAVIEMGLAPLLLLAGAGTVFMLAPLIIRHVWDTAPMPAGDLRDRLMAMCERHGVGVRELLLWRTFGGMVNAAVMGLVGPLRYILLTDALVETVHEEEVEAVMAHELAHVKRKHMVWLLIAAVGTLGAVELGFIGAYAVLAEAGLVAAVWEAMVTSGVSEQSVATGAFAAAVLAAGLCWAGLFGWVSRRFERQADTFAVQHLTAKNAESRGEPSERAVVDAFAAMTMIGALQRVAELNYSPTARRSWRHGSIAWRQAYLKTLVGRRVDELPIDRQMWWINAASLLVVAVLMIWQMSN